MGLYRGLMMNKQSTGLLAASYWTNLEGIGIMYSAGMAREISVDSQLDCLWQTSTPPWSCIWLISSSLCEEELCNRNLKWVANCIPLVVPYLCYHNNTQFSECLAVPKKAKTVPAGHTVQYTPHCNPTVFTMLSAKIYDGRLKQVIS